MTKNEINTRKLKEDFSFLKPKLERKEIFAVLLYGSYAKNEQHSKSDIDVCIVAPKCKSIEEIREMLKYIWRNVNTDKYDVRIFEELPLYIKISVIKNNKIIFVNDEQELRYYFYFISKLWNDQIVNWIYKKVG